MKAETYYQPKTTPREEVTAEMAEAGWAVIEYWLEKSKNGKCIGANPAEIYRAMRNLAPRPKTYAEMSTYELQAEISKIQALLVRKVGDPRIGVTTRTKL